jgi:cell wall-associated NlpC family hydrolase
LLRRRGLLLVLAVSLVLAGVIAPGATAATASTAASARATRAASGARIVAVAKRYVGKARYREGGASPRRGFDCSGYTQYAYRIAKVAKLPHNAEAQRHGPHMHRISARAARPGDLVFYMSGGRAFHVAIYAGHHKQYAAATTTDGIRYQNVWSSNVQYRTDWH